MPWRFHQAAVLLACVLVWGAGCTPKQKPAPVDAGVDAVAPNDAGADDVPADTAQVPDTAIDVDNQDVAVHGTDAEVVDAALPDTDTDAGDTIADAKDAADAADTAPADPCKQLGKLVQPTDLPDGSSCTVACAPGYPCTCGVCPWVQTPPLVYPRVSAQAFWTGEEFLVFGGISAMGSPASAPWWLSAERWNPSKGKGFELLPLPGKVKQADNGWSEHRIFWTGTQVVVIADQIDSFRYVAKTGQFLPVNQKDKPSPILYSHTVFAGGKVVAWRLVTGLLAFTLYDPVADTWEDLALPASYPTGLYPSKMFSHGEDVYLLNLASQSDATWPNGQQGTKSPVTVRLHVLSKTFELLPPPPPELTPALAKTNVAVSAAASPDGFLVWGLANGVSTASGVTYRKSKGAWSTVSSSGAPTYALQIWWLGGRFVVSASQPELKTPAMSGPPHWPTFYDPDLNQWSQPPVIGLAADPRAYYATAYEGDELFLFGGIGGPPCCTEIHANGVRLSLPAKSSGGVP